MFNVVCLVWMDVYSPQKTGTSSFDKPALLYKAGTQDDKFDDCFPVTRNQHFSHLSPVPCHWYFRHWLFNRFHFRFENFFILFQTFSDFNIDGIAKTGFD